MPGWYSALMPSSSSDDVGPRGHRAVLVGTTLDHASVRALRRASALAVRFRARLHVIHVLPSSGPLIVHDAPAREKVIRWAVDAGVALPYKDVVIGVGDAGHAIRRAAREANAELIVVGRPSGPLRTTGTVASLVACASWSILVADRARNPRQLVAATDLRDRRFPVIQSAVKLASAMASQITVVHNVEHEGSAPALPTNAVVHRLIELERLAGTLDSVRGASVASKRTATEAILDVALARDADLVIVGVRRGHGTTVLSLMDHAQQSILALPLPAMTQAREMSPTWT